MPVPEKELKKVMVTDDIIEAAGSICREVFGKSNAAPYEKSCMIALAWSVAKDGQEAEVGDSEITVPNGLFNAVGYSLDQDTAERIVDFDRWVQVPNAPDAVKPEPFCLYVNDRDYVASIHPDFAADGDVGQDDEEEDDF